MKSATFDRLMQSVEEARDHARGKKSLKTTPFGNPEGIQSTPEGACDHSTEEGRRMKQHRKEQAYRLAMLGLQSRRYQEDVDYREAVDDVLLWSNPFGNPEGIQSTPEGVQENPDGIRRETQAEYFGQQENPDK